MIKAIIVDDEKKSVQTMSLMLKEYCPDVEVIGFAHSAIEGAKEVISKKPDLLFLDVEMTGGSGFDLLESLPERNFKVIFVTAHDHYALKAIKFHAIDYVLKPIDVEDLKNAVANFVSQKTNNLKVPSDIERLLEHMKVQKVKKIAVPTTNGIEYLAIDEIMYFTADRSYCKIVLTNNRSILVSKGLSEIEDLLPTENFFRIHKSNTVNLAFVKKHLKTDGGIVELTDGTKLYIARTKKDEFMLAMEKFL
ncbi:MAG: response regulator transcription factor [Bacteroidia bacterium]|nr:response regulator transcription factor [Bacteroidia bacterium]